MTNRNKLLGNTGEKFGRAETIDMYVEQGTHDEWPIGVRSLVTVESQIRRITLFPVRLFELNI